MPANPDIRSEVSLRSYAVFISYRHADNKAMGRQWATWLHQSLETYEVPPDLIGSVNLRGEPVVSSLYPVFRDEEELPADADLSKNIQRALEHSALMVVLCSPRAVQSKFVADEIRYFKELGKSERILALMIDGEPNASEDPAKQLAGMTAELECLPEPLRYGVPREDGTIDWKSRTEPIAADVRPEGMPVQGWTAPAAYLESIETERKLSTEEKTRLTRQYEERLELAKLKVIAGALGLPLGELTQRNKAYQLRRARERARRLRAVAAVFIVLTVLAAGFGVFAFRQQHVAEGARQVAVEAQNETERNLEKLRKTNFANQIAAAGKSMSANDAPRARSILMGLDHDLRNWEWALALARCGPAPVTLAELTDQAGKIITVDDVDRFRLGSYIGLDATDNVALSHHAHLLLNWRQSSSRGGSQAGVYRLAPETLLQTAWAGMYGKVKSAGFSPDDSCMALLLDTSGDMRSPPVTAFQDAVDRGTNIIAIPEFFDFRKPKAEDIQRELMYPITSPRGIGRLPPRASGFEMEHTVTDLDETGFRLDGVRYSRVKSAAANEADLWEARRKQAVPGEREMPVELVKRLRDVIAQTNAASKVTKSWIKGWITQEGKPCALVYSTLGMLELWDATTQRKLRSYGEPQPAATSTDPIEEDLSMMSMSDDLKKADQPGFWRGEVALSADGKWVACFPMGQQDRCQIFDVESGALKATMLSSRGKPIAEGEEAAYTVNNLLYFSPKNGELFFHTAGRNESYGYIWDAKSGKMLKRFGSGFPEEEEEPGDEGKAVKAEENSVDDSDLTGVAWDPQGRFVAMAREGLQIYDRLGGKMLLHRPDLRLYGNMNQRPSFQIHASPDSSRVLIGQYLFDPTTWELMGEMPGPTVLNEDWTIALTFLDEDLAQYLDLRFWQALKKGDLSKLTLRERLLLNQVTLADRKEEAPVAKAESEAERLAGDARQELRDARQAVRDKEPDAAEALAAAEARVLAAVEALSAESSHLEKIGYDAHYARAGRAFDAAFAKILTRARVSPVVRTFYGWLQYRKGRMEEAKKQWDLALEACKTESAQPSAELSLGLACIDWNAGREAEAVGRYEQALKASLALGSTQTLKDLRLWSDTEKQLFSTVLQAVKKKHGFQTQPSSLGTVELAQFLSGSGDGDAACGLFVEFFSTLLSGQEETYPENKVPGLLADNGRFLLTQLNPPRVEEFSAALDAAKAKLPGDATLPKLDQFFKDWRTAREAGKNDPAQTDTQLLINLLSVHALSRNGEAWFRSWMDVLTVKGAALFPEWGRQAEELVKNSQDSDVEGLFWGGWTLLIGNKPAEALAAWRQAEKLQTAANKPAENTQVLRALSIGLWISGDKAGAIAVEKRRIDMDAALRSKDEKHKPAMPAGFLNMAPVVVILGETYAANLAQHPEIAPEEAGDLGTMALNQGINELAVSLFTSALRMGYKEMALANVYYYRGLARMRLNQNAEAVRDFTETLAIIPKAENALRNRGLTFGKMGDFKAMLADQRELVKLLPKSAQDWNSLGWTLATCPQAEYRNGEEAVAAATRACELTQWESRNELDTLAAAEAEAGKFDDAVKHQKQVLTMGEFEKAERERAEMRLKLYEEKKPWHDP